MSVDEQHAGWPLAVRTTDGEDDAVFTALPASAAPVSSASSNVDASR